MKTLLKSIFVGLFVTIVGGIILHLMTSNQNNNRPPADRPKRTVFFKEIQDIKSETLVRVDSNGQKQPVSVWAYIDLDHGKHDRSNADVVIRTPFFNNASGSYIRSLNSNMHSMSGECRGISENMDGSAEKLLSNTVRYCIRTNQGRIGSISVNRILNSWGKYAETNVRASLVSYND